MLQAEVSCYEKSPDTLSVEVFRLVAAPRMGRGVLLSHTLPGWPCRDPHTAPGCHPGAPVCPGTSSSREATIHHGAAGQGDA